MKKITPVLALLLVLSACTSKEENISTEGLPEQAVEHCFSTYKSAILKQNGEAAVEQLADRTIDQYQNYVNWALHAERSELESLSFINRMQVIILRHRVPVETLKSLDGRSALVYAVNHDWIGKNEVIRTELGDIDISDSRATSRVLVGDQEAPNRFQFIFENGSWKFDLSSVITDSNPAMIEAAKRAGKDENDFLFLILESISGKKVSDDIWQPIQ